MMANTASVLFSLEFQSMTDPNIDSKIFLSASSLQALGQTGSFVLMTRLQAGKTNGDVHDGKTGTGTATKTRTKTQRPSLYRVLLLNDDYTPMEFVVLILQDVFNKSREDAMQIMLHVHQQGVGECGIYPYEVAETKVTRVMDSARKNQHPLQCVMEKQ
jgi:ATP-dependent Clp protease adaptor protein ClpS